MMKKKMISFKKIASIFLILDISLITLSIFMGGLWLLNTQAGFICSMIIVLGSYRGYKNMVDTRAYYYDESLDTKRELLDEIEDPYELYEDEEAPKTKYEKIKTSAKNTKDSISGFFSLYRVFGYIFLIATSLFLIKKGLFSPIAFFVGLGTTTILVLVYALLISKEKG